MRRFTSCVVGLLALAPAGAAPSLEGTWRQVTPKIGQSDWHLIDKGDGTYRAQEYGLGRAHGTAHFKDHVLTIDWKTDEGGVGVWEWTLDGKSGLGALIVPDDGSKPPGSVRRKRHGKNVLAFEKSKLRPLEPPYGLVEIWRQNTPGLGDSTWTLVKDGANHYRAVETGLGEMRGKAVRKDGVLRVAWKNDDEEAFYEWKLDGKSGRGALIYVKGGPDLPGMTTRQHEGKSVRAVGSTVTRQLFKADPDAPARVSLPVKLVGQKYGCWCFAAATQMVLNYHQTRVTQGELLNVFTGRKDCMKTPTPEPCLVSGGELPLLNHFQYTCELRHGPMTPDELIHEFHTQRKPIIFGWDTTGGGHSLVAVGYVKVKAGFLVEVLNPSPIGVGERMLCTYQQWLDGDGYVFQDSIFNITRPKTPAPKSK